MQIQPRTVVVALLPSPVKIGGGQLRPVTIGGLALLHAIKSPFVEEGEPTALETFVAGYILSRPWAYANVEHQDGTLGDNAMAWTKANQTDRDQLEAAIRDVIATGYSSAAKLSMPAADGSITIESPSPDGNGLGYLLTLIETLCATYPGWTIEYVFDRPVITAYAMVAAHRVNEGAIWKEPNYFERDRGTEDIAAYLKNMKVA